MEEPMDRHTTFRVGGPAECFVTVDTRGQLAKVLAYLQNTERDFFILGNGSNLLVSDRGYRGVVVSLGKEFRQICVKDGGMSVGAGVSLAQAAKAAMQAGLSGLEFAAGIPGTMGGAVRMNAGAYGGEMAQVAEAVEVMAADGEILLLDNETMEFGYRVSAIKSRPYVVLGVDLKLDPAKTEDIAGRMQELAQRRREKQPLEYPSAGSTFKRPEGLFAGKLIMEAGCAEKAAAAHRFRRNTAVSSSTKTMPRHRMWHA